MKKNLVFNCKWFAEKAEDNYLEEYILNPDFQVEQSAKNQIRLFEEFGQFDLGTPDPEPFTNVNCVGVATMGILFGGKVHTEWNKDPYLPALDLDDKGIMSLNPLTRDDFEKSDYIRKLVENFEYMKRKYGKSFISINFQSTLNTAFKLRGDELFYDFYEKPEIVDKVLSVAYESTINLREYIDEINSQCQDVSNLIASIDNCTAAYISPQLYRDFVFKFDMLHAEKFKSRLMVHHCGSNMHLFAQDYAKLGKAKVYDIGYGSDLNECKKYFNEEAFLSVRFGPAVLRNESPDFIRNKIFEMEKDGANYLLTIGADPDTPMKNIEAYFGID